MVPEIGGTRLWRIIVSRGCEDYSSDGILDKRNSKHGPNVRQEEGDEERPHLEKVVVGVERRLRLDGDLEYGLFMVNT